MAWTVIFTDRFNDWYSSSPKDYRIVSPRSYGTYVIPARLSDARWSIR